MRSMLIRNLPILACASVLLACEASAQTTITLTAPDTQVTDTTIGAGSAASTVYNTDRLTARLSTDVNAVRRGILKFDTSTTIPAGTTITSARLTVYVRGGAGATTRRIGVYPVTKPFQESEATWIHRKTGYQWSTAGGDLGAKVGEVTAPLTAGTALTIDVTALVQQVVKDPSSRYTRIALIDVGTADSTSYREFHSSETSTTAYRPKLVVVYASSSAPPPPPPPSTGTTLKVLDWNTHYGVGTDGVYNLDRIATHIARFNPDVISLNEVTRRSHYNTSEDQIVRYVDLLRAKTGRTWYYYYRTDNGASTGVGNAVLSRYPIASTSYCQLSTRRVAVNAAVTVNGRLVNVWSTHLDSSTGNSLRITEVRNLLACIGSFAEQRIVAGDFNAASSTTEIGLMNATFYDAWAKAAANGAAVSYPGNTAFGATRNGRIDYVFYSKAASYLVLQRAEVFDTRAANGVMPSDHKPLMATFAVR